MTKTRFSASRPLRCSLALLATAATGFAGVFYPEGATTLHFPFEGSPNGDRPIVRPPAIYHAEDGFGFVDSPGLVGTARGVTAPKYFRFDVNLPVGSYDITVTLGGAETDSTTSIKAENRPTTAQNIAVARGQSITQKFTVSVQSRPAIAPATVETDHRLTLEFEGTNPSLMKLDIKPSAGSPAK